MRRFTLKERAVSLLLAAVLLLGLIPISGVLAKDDAAPTVRVTQDGAEVTAIDLPENEKTTLTAACKGAAAYQWQIQIPGAGVWVDIYDKTDAGCEVSSALVSSMLDSNNAARLRCTATVDETMYNSAAITVTLTESSAAAPQDEPLETAGYVVESETIIPPADTPAGDDTPADDTPADDTSAAQTDPAAADDTSTAQDDTPAQGDSITDDTARTADPAAEDNTAPADDTPAVQDDTPAAADGTDPTADPAADDTPAGDDTPAAQADPAAGDDTAPANDTPAAQDASASAEGLSAGSSGRTAAYAAARGSTGLSVQLLGAEGEGAGVMPLADDPDLTKHTVRIKYLYDTEDPTTNGSVANDYIATVASGTPLIATVQSPVRTGYKAYLAQVESWNDTNGYWFTKDINGHYIESGLVDGTTVPINISSVTKDVTYYVVYLPQETTFQVKSYLQNVLDDYYTFAGAATQTARVGDSVLLLDITGRQGYSRLQYDDAKVAADGSTVLEIYYDREYHLINFDLGGGYGVTPIYARYQTELRVAAPTRAGYVFAGWEVEKVMYNGVDLTSDFTHKIEDATYASNSYDGWTFKDTADTLATELTGGKAIEMPAFDIRLKAKWTPQTVTYTVVYWLQNANDDAYSYLTSSTVNSTADETITSDQFNPGTELTKLPTAFIAADTEGNYKYYSYNEAKTRAMNPGTITVKGDSSTIINIYYDRNEYEIRYVYARAKEARTYKPLSAIESGKAYYIQNNRHGGYLTSTVCEGYATSLSFGSEERLIFTQVAGGYTIQNEAGKYLQIKYSEAAFVDTVQTLSVEYNKTGKYWTIGENFQYLNYFGGGQVGKDRAAGYGNQNDQGTYLTLYSADEPATVSYTTIQGSYNTGAGYDSSDGGDHFSSLDWSLSFGSVPRLNGSFEQKTFVDSKDGYTYFYVSLTARYGADISNSWPYNAVQGVTPYAFGSWAASKNCDYRKLSPNNANIIGTYPTMSAELIENPDNPLAQIMVAWWASGADGADDHSYCIYFEMYPGETAGESDTVIQVGDKKYRLVDTYTFTCAHNGNTRCDPIQYDGLDCITSSWPGARLSLNDPADVYIDSIHYISYDYVVTSPWEKGTLYVDATNNGINSYYVKDADPTTKYSVYVQSTDIEINGTYYYLTTSRFLYNRSTHDLVYYNNGSAAKTPKSITNLMYGQGISDYEITAEEMKNTYYPDNLEPGAYEFAGWYTTSEFVDGTEVDWASATIPNGDLILYAKWVPVQHTVTFYETYNDMVEGKPIANSTENANPQQIDHGATVNYPSTISRDGYTFVGWFYIDSSGDTKAFLPNNMPVNEDLKIYAEWQSETMIRYTIHYMQVTAVETEESGEGIFLFADNKRYKLDFTKELTQIADDTTGQIQDGRTKTFTAKALPQLWGPDDPNNPNKGVDYCHNYYPLLASHAIMFDKDTVDQKQEWESLDPSKAALQIKKITDEQGAVVSYEVEYTFFYVYLAGIQYKVRYLNAADDTNVFKNFAANASGTITMTVDPKTVGTNEAITTESMKLINGYVPDEYQKRLVLTAFPRPDTDDNVITFYYTENSDPMYFVEHLIENADGTWTQMSREFGTGTEGTMIARTANTYNGHTFNAEQAWVNSTGERIKPSEGENWVATNGTDAEGKAYYKGTYTGQEASGTLQKNQILVIRFYYTLEKYPYRIEHRIVGKTEGNDWLFGTKESSTETGSEVYGAVVTGDASDDNPVKPWATEAYKRGYWVEGSRENPSLLKKSITISVDASTPTVNVITFWYVDSPVEIGYRVVADGKVGENGDIISGCYVNPSLTSTSSHETASIGGSVPYAGSGYRFVGWYKDEACTDPVTEEAWVDAANNNKLTPQPEGEYNILAAALYYAKFEPITLTIKKEAAAGTTIGTNETFLFRVQGKADDPNTEDVDVTVSITGAGHTTIAYLPAGKYTVTELTNWSWRYGCESNSRTVMVTENNATNSVTFTNARNSKKWLGGENYCINKFAAAS